ncbi:sugar-phosphatase [Marinilactibacillus sp. Marseille-P9653]|uniref:sugar-phosphatase n=1 Tax=Marinilactibacillus sp. Marseille-P9653 TaxID=2866583 RepID=UPI001CE435A6|nr:sugar-phosphatase [Marinilactibacillus sp. Marseille-P9653]
MKKDLIAIDMDGTLLNPDRKVTDEVKKAIHEAKSAGIKIVLCTGRPYPGVTAYLEELDLRNSGDYVITYNGALVQKSDTEEIVSQHTMDQQDYITLEKAAREANVHFHAIRNSGIYTPNKDIGKYSVLESHINQVPLFYSAPEDMDTDTPYNKMMMIDDEELLEAAIKQLPKELWEKYTILRSEPFFLEFLNKKANKGIALEDLANSLNIPRERVMSIGDGGNDVHMIEYAGTGVAMGNAKDAVKDVADAFTTSNAENGVAKAIRDFAL